MGCLAATATWLSYFCICLTFPVTLWFCFKKVAQWERLIVFRLGRLRGVLGPGMVFIIPWLDNHTQVDMRTKAFSVPPQQVSLIWRLVFIILISILHLSVLFVHYYSKYLHYSSLILIEIDPRHAGLPLKPFLSGLVTLECL